MENLDELMRKKFGNDPGSSGNRFEFREEYWEQAQALLEAAEARRRKRRRWLIWWMLFGFFVAVGAWQWGRSSNSSNGQSRVETPATNGGDSNAGNNSSSGQTATEAQGRQPGTVQPQDGDILNGLQPDGKAIGTTPAHSKKDTENQGAGTKSGDAKTTTPDRSVQRFDSGKSSSVPSQNTGAGKPTGADNKATDRKGVQAGTDEKNNLSGNPASELATASASLASNEPDSLAAAWNDLKGSGDFSALPTLSGLLEVPGRDLDTPSVTPYAYPIEPVRVRKFSFGIAGAATLSQASPDGKRLGATGGLFVQYKLSPSWSLTGGANWRFLAGDWADDTLPTMSKQLKYSFGYKEDTWELETRGLHSIEIPLGLRWQRGKMAAEAGFSPGFLLGVQGRLINRHSESLQEDTATIGNSKVWLDKTPYYQFIPALFLGAEWKATRKIGLALRGTYRPGKIGDNPTDAPSPANLIWLDAGLRWYF